MPTDSIDIAPLTGGFFGKATHRASYAEQPLRVRSVAGIYDYEVGL
jgi:hypothetical protein